MDDASKAVAKATHGIGQDSSSVTTNSNQSETKIAVSRVQGGYIEFIDRLRRRNNLGRK